MSVQLPRTSAHSLSLSAQLRAALSPAHLGPVARPYRHVRGGDAVVERGVRAAGRSIVLFRARSGGLIWPATSGRNVAETTATDTRTYGVWECNQECKRQNAPS